MCTLIGAQIFDTVSFSYRDLMANVFLFRSLYSVMRREFLKTETCDFSLSTEEFMEEQIALTMPMNSPYIDVFNAGRLKLSGNKFKLKKEQNQQIFEFVSK